MERKGQLSYPHCILGRTNPEIYILVSPKLWEEDDKEEETGGSIRNTLFILMGGRARA